MTQLPCDYLVLHFLTFGTVLSTHTNTNTLQCKRKSSKSSNVEINNLSSCCLETWRPPLDVAIHIENRNLVIMQLYAQFELKLMTLLCTRRRSSFLLGRYIFFLHSSNDRCACKKSIAFAAANDDQRLQRARKCLLFILDFFPKSWFGWMVATAAAVMSCESIFSSVQKEQLNFTHFLLSH